MPLVEFLCLYCGTKNIKYRSPSSLKKGRGRFCNHSCRQKSRVGDKNSNYRGNNIKYQALHDWIANVHGKPKKCEKCKTTKAKRYEWSNISGKYKRNVSDWQRLCASCHRKYDGIGINPYSNGRRKPIKQFTLNGKFIKEYISLCEASRQTGVNQGNITNVAHNRCKSAGGYIWQYA